MARNIGGLNTVLWTRLFRKNSIESRKKSIFYRVTVKRDRK